MILSATSRSLFSQDMGGDGFLQWIADANLASRAGRQLRRKTGADSGYLESLSRLSRNASVTRATWTKRPPVRNGHDLVGGLLPGPLRGRARFDSEVGCTNAAQTVCENYADWSAYQTPAPCVNGARFAAVKYPRLP